MSSIVKYILESIPCPVMVAALQLNWFGPGLGCFEKLRGPTYFSERWLLAFKSRRIHV